MTLRHAILCKYQKVCQQPGGNVSHQLPTPRCNNALHGLTPVAIKENQSPWHSLWEWLKRVRDGARVNNCWESWQSYVVVLLRFFPTCYSLNHLRASTATLSLQTSKDLYLPISLQALVLLHDWLSHLSPPRSWIQMSAQSIFHDPAVADTPQASVLHRAECHQNALEVLGSQIYQVFHEVGGLKHPSVVWFLWSTMNLQVQTQQK